MRRSCIPREGAPAAARWHAAATARILCGRAGGGRCAGRIPIIPFGYPFISTISDKSSWIFCDEGSLRHLLIPPWIWLKMSHIIKRGSFERPVKSDLESLLAP